MPVSDALKDGRQAAWSLVIFSGVVNLLMLAGPLYMLQIYDRVLASRSVPTLVALSLFLVGAYAFQGALDVVRTRIVTRTALVFDRHLVASVHDAVLHLASQTRRPSEAQQPVRDLDQIRSFLMSAGPIAIVDLPWIPVFLAICFLIHPWLGVVSLAGAIVMLALTLANERAGRQPVRAVAEQAGLRFAAVDADRRNSEAAAAMGMGKVLSSRWEAINRRYVATLTSANDVANSFASISKVFRLLLQSLMLGVGAYLVIRQEMTAGAMIAASIMMGRALAPIDTAIANWRGFLSARQSIQRLSRTLSETRPEQKTTELPKPTKSFAAEDVTVIAPGATEVIVANVRFDLKAGEVLGVIGPNGAGKTSLVRTLVGIWRPAKGQVKFDGAPLDQWRPEVIGRHIGYVSQGADLFEGTVAENISRMQIGASSEAVMGAAQAAGAHDMVLRLPNGYDTSIGEGGASLSVGQRQRIAIARALYGEPFFVVFDEPSANLDNDGEVALHQTIRDLKARGAIVIIVAHRPSALALCDKVLFIANGAQRGFGARDEILQRVLARPAAPRPAAVLKAVGEKPEGDR